jgi:ABC-type branched-subunit amino acid transport system permease subunit
MGLEMTTVLWFVFAITALQLGALGALWVHYVVQVHAARHEHVPPPEHPTAPTA